jgi:hypothetical protein
MWLAVVLIAITCGGTVFMVRFLVALLREGAPSVCYWVIPERNKADRWRPQAGEFEDGSEIGSLTSFSSGAVLLTRWAGYAGDPSLRLKNGSDLDDIRRWPVAKPWEARTRTIGSNRGGKA